MCSIPVTNSLLRLTRTGQGMSAIFLLIVLQLIGEGIVQVSGLPVPGAVVGLVLLYAMLTWRGEVSEEMSRTSGFLLQNLGVLFVPAGVGVIAYLPLIAAQWGDILLVLIVSVCSTIAITGLVVARLSPRRVDTVEGTAQS
jgi:holin-like protein